MLDVARALGLPVVLVVGVRLGCLHHALAAELAIRMRGLELAGWVANRIDPAMDGRRRERGRARRAHRRAAPRGPGLERSFGRSCSRRGPRVDRPGRGATPRRTPCRGGPRVAPGGRTVLPFCCFAHARPSLGPRTGPPVANEVPSPQSGVRATGPHRSAPLDAHARHGPPAADRRRRRSDRRPAQRFARPRVALDLVRRDGGGQPGARVRLRRRRRLAGAPVFRARTRLPRAGLRVDRAPLARLRERHDRTRPRGDRAPHRRPQRSPRTRADLVPRRGRIARPRRRSDHHAALGTASRSRSASTCRPRSASRSRDD